MIEHINGDVYCARSALGPRTSPTSASCPVYPSIAGGCPDIIGPRRDRWSTGLIMRDARERQMMGHST